jgi:protein ImuB
MACVDVPALPLQILLRRHSDWGSLPIAIVDRDKPLGIIQCVNEHARRMRILPGMRYATALSLSRDLRAGVVADTEIAEYVGRLTRWLWRFSPRIEPSSKEPGVFWVDASGLCPLYASLQEWALEVRDNLRQAGFESVVGIGFSLFDTDHEHKYLRKVPIDRLGFEPELRDKLFKLGIRTLGGFVDLPAVGIRKRFGSEAHALHEMARGSGWASLEPEPYRAPITRTMLLEYPETNPDRSIAR